MKKPTAGDLPPAAFDGYGVPPFEADKASARPTLWMTILALLVMQVVVTDAGFVYYAFSNEWKLPAEVVMVWLATASIQIILLTLVLVRREQ